MKILHIVEAFTGGIFDIVMNMSNELAARGHKVTIVYSTRVNTPENLGSYFSNGIELRKMNMVRSISPLRDTLNLAKLVKTIKIENPDIVHLHSSKAGFIGRVAARICGLGKNVYYSPHDLAYTVSKGMKKHLYYLVERLGLVFGNNLIACSKGEYDEINDRLTDNVKLLNNAIDNSLFNRVVIDYKGRYTSKNIATVGRLSEQKNPKLFLEIARKNRDYNFFWIGDGDYMKDELLRESNITVTGWLKKDELIAYLNSSFLYMQTSISEGMPIAVIEAQAVGLPCLVTDAVGNRDIISNDYNGYVLPFDADMFNQKMAFLRGDKTIYFKLSYNSKENVYDNYLIDHYVDKLLDIYSIEDEEQHSHRHPVVARRWA